MTQKRIRNKKIENKQPYKIFIESALDKSKIQEHVEIQINTGMEEEEKEEHHLKSALKNESSIPIPLIISKNSENNLPVFKKSKEYIKYSSDVENQYILSSEDKEFIEKHNYNESEFLNEANNIKEENEQYIKKVDELSLNDPLRNYLQERLLLLHDETDFNSYACFRKRIIKTGRKSRKVESNINEKIKRVWEEINLIEKLIQNSNDIFTKELDVEKCENEIIKMGKSLGRKNNKKIVNKVIGIKRKVDDNLFYKKYKFDELFADRRKMNEFKYLVKNSKLDNETVENEANILEKYYF